MQFTLGDKGEVYLLGESVLPVTKKEGIIFWACLIQAWLPDVKQSKVARYDMHNMCVHNERFHNVFTIIVASTGL